MMTTLLYGYLLVAIVLDHAHLACPITLAWSDRAYRQRMLTRPGKFILLPAFAVGMAVAIGLGSHSTREPTFRMLALTYLWWNAWHFGSQHFGVASLLGWSSGPRWLRQGVLILPTMWLMLFAGPAVWIAGEVISFAHWTTDIGLSAWAVRRRWPRFVWAAMILGLSGFLWKTVAADPRLCGSAPACTALWSIPTLVSLRYGLGFYHFLMSRWVWSGEGRALLRAA
jgi:hypothetical protein